jgi:hypothetical protein
VSDTSYGALETRINPDDERELLAVGFVQLPALLNVEAGFILLADGLTEQLETALLKGLTEIDDEIKCFLVRIDESVSSVVSLKGSTVLLRTHAVALLHVLDHKIPDSGKITRSWIRLGFVHPFSFSVTSCEPGRRIQASSGGYPRDLLPRLTEQNELLSL